MLNKRGFTLCTFATLVVVIGIPFCMRILRLNLNYSALVVLAVGLLGGWLIAIILTKRAAKRLEAGKKDEKID